MVEGEGWSRRKDGREEVSGGGGRDGVGGRMEGRE